MTKRFIEFMTQNSDDGNLNCGFTDIRTNEWYHTKDRVNAKKCVDILNQLNEENEQLKSDYDTLKIQDDARKQYQKELMEENEELKQSLNKLLNDEQYWEKKAKQRITELEKENEQLKSTINAVTELLVKEVDVFSDKATEHDINAYLELKELDNKDAFCMAISTKKAIKMLKELIE